MPNFSTYNGYLPDNYDLHRQHESEQYEKEQRYREEEELDEWEELEWNSDY